MDESKLATLKLVLDETVEWPTEYLFKFIVPIAEKESLIALLGDSVYSCRPSKNGNYTSVTMKKHLGSSEEVITIYLRVSSVKGIISF